MNYYKGSFLDEGFDKYMKDVWELDGIDIIVSNPPYNNMIYKKFTNKSLLISTLNLFVIPSTFTVSITGEKLIKSLLENGLKKISFIKRKYFEVDIDTLYYLTLKKYNKKILINNTFYINRYENINDYCCEIEFNLFKKLKKFGNIDLKKGKNDTLNYKNPKETDNIKFNKSETNNIKLLSRLNGGRGEEIYWLNNCIYDNCDKLVFPRGTQSYHSINTLKNFNKDIVFNKFVDKKTPISKGLMYIEIDKKNNKKLQWYLMRSKLIRFIFIKRNMFSELTKGLFKYIPKIDLNIILNYKDEEVYEYFNLNKEEIDLIEKTVK